MRGCLPIAYWNSVRTLRGNSRIIVYYMSVFFRDDLASMQCALRVIFGKSDLKEVSVDLADKEHIIYVNGSCRGGDTALGRLMQDFFCRKVGGYAL